MAPRRVDDQCGQGYHAGVRQVGQLAPDADLRAPVLHVGRAVRGAPSPPPPRRRRRSADLPALRRGSSVRCRARWPSGNGARATPRTVAAVPLSALCRTPVGIALRPVTRRGLPARIGATAPAAFRRMATRSSMFDEASRQRGVQARTATMKSDGTGEGRPRRSRGRAPVPGLGWTGHPGDRA